MFSLATMPRYSNSCRTRGETRPVHPQVYAELLLRLSCKRQRLSNFADSFRLQAGSGLVWFYRADERILFVARPPCVPA